MRAFVAALLLASVASAEDQQACRYEGDFVVCTKDGFTKITHRYLELESAVRLSTVERAALMEQVEKLRNTVVTCPEVMTPVKQESQSGRALGYALGIIGTAAAVVAPFTSASTTVKGFLVAGGVSAIGLGYAFVF